MTLTASVNKDNFDNTGDNINEYESLKKIIYQHLHDLHSVVNQYFPNAQCMTAQNHVWAKDPFKTQEKTMDYIRVKKSQ